MTDFTDIETIAGNLELYGVNDPMQVITDFKNGALILDQPEVHRYLEKFFTNNRKNTKHKVKKYSTGGVK